MTRTLLIIIALMFLFTIFQFVFFYRMNKDVTKIESQVDRLSEALADVTFEGAGKEPADSKNGDAQNKNHLLSVEVRLQAVLRRLDMLESRGYAIEEELDHKLGTQKSLKKKKKRRVRTRKSLADVANELDLTSGQQMDLSEAIDDLKVSLFRLVEQAQSDDSVILDRIKDTLFERAPAKKKMREIVLALASEVPPGSEQSYYHTLVEIRERAADDFEKILSTQQLKRFYAMRLGPFNIDTGYYPFLDATSATKR